MTEREIKMLAELRALECMKSYWEAEMSYWATRSEAPNGVISSEMKHAQEELFQLSKKFREI